MAGSSRLTAKQSGSDKHAPPVLMILDDDEVDDEDTWRGAHSDKTDGMDAHLSRILEVVPDVQPDHALALLHQYSLEDKKNVTQIVLDALFEDPTYPKVDIKGKGAMKRKRIDEDEAPPPTKLIKIDYGSTDRPLPSGSHYYRLAVEQLGSDFPYIPKPYLRAKLLSLRALYAPTYLALLGDASQNPLPYKPKAKPTRVTGKGTSRDADLEKEREWIIKKLRDQETEQDGQLAKDIGDNEFMENGAGIECGCCFTEYAFENMVQCPECHLFCKDCVNSYASDRLGSRNANITCMDQSGCKLPFPESELARFLSPKMLDLYHRIMQSKEIEQAGLEGLEECPFCDYKVVIENPEEKLFRCDNEECGAVSCRNCKKTDHLPKSCKEAEADRHLDGRHAIEEAMTRALMRNCPKCSKAFVKEMGCNKMLCPHCNTLSCYVCRQVIVGYDHFDQTPPRQQPKKPKKCPLWDAVEERHANEVAEAAKAAIEEYKKHHPDVEDKEINVDLPKAPPRPAPPVLQHVQNVLPHPPLHPGRVQHWVNAQANIGFPGLQPPPMAVFGQPVVHNWMFAPLIPAPRAPPLPRAPRGVARRR